MAKGVKEERVLLIAGVALIVAMFGLFALLIFSLVHHSVRLYRKRRRLNPTNTPPESSRPDSVSSSTISRLSSAVSASSLANGDLPLSEEKGAFGGGRRTLADAGAADNGKVGFHLPFQVPSTFPVNNNGSNNNNILRVDLEDGIAGAAQSSNDVNASQHHNGVTTTTTVETLRLHDEPVTSGNELPPLGSCRFSPKTSVRSIAQIAPSVDNAAGRSPPEANNDDAEASAALAETANVTFENLEAVTERAFRAELRKASLASAAAVSPTSTALNGGGSPRKGSAGGCTIKAS